MFEFKGKRVANIKISSVHAQTTHTFINSRYFSLFWCI